MTSTMRKSGAIGTWRSVWRALESLGRQRARAEMNAVADLYGHSRPQLARLLRAASAHRSAA